MTVIKPKFLKILCKFSVFALYMKFLSTRLKADVSSVVSPLIRSDEGLTLEMSAFNLFTVVNLPYQLS